MKLVFRSLLLGLLMVMCTLPFYVKAEVQTLSKKKVDLDIGKTYTLKINNMPKDATVKFTSADKKIATVVAKSGKITAVAEGTVKINAKITYADKTTKSMTCTVTVTDPDPAKRVFTITPDSDPYYPIYKWYHTYNEYTKHYMLLISYMNEFERAGGGTLVLTKGTYTITNTIFIPSNVTIKLEDGVKIVKGTVTEVYDQPASHSVFTFCEPSKAYTEGAYKKFEGVHDSAIIATGKVTFNLKYDERTLGITLCHCKNIQISGIDFLNMNSGHFIECDASKNVSITDCSFKGHKDSEKNNKEAINIDTPDLATGGITAIWTSYDKTGNNGVTIRNCTFKNLERAIGTHKFSGGHPHYNITIEDCLIDGCDNDAIRVMNWQKFTITNNTFKNITNKSNLRGILISGARSFNISYNNFVNIPRAMQFIVWHQDDGNYKDIKNVINNREKQLLMTNTIKKGTEAFIRWNKVLDVFDKDTEKIPINQAN